MPARPRPASPGDASFIPSEPETTVKTALRPVGRRRGFVVGRAAVVHDDVDLAGVGRRAQVDGGARAGARPRRHRPTAKGAGEKLRSGAAQCPEPLRSRAQTGSRRGSMPRRRPRALESPCHPTRSATTSLTRTRELTPVRTWRMPRHWRPHWQRTPRRHAPNGRGPLTTLGRADWMESLQAGQQAAAATADKAAEPGKSAAAASRRSMAGALSQLVRPSVAGSRGRETWCEPALCGRRACHSGSVGASLAAPERVLAVARW